MTRPTVSVITTSYNQAQWLEDNLASVARQSYPQIEHVVMDGGSSDGSVSMLEAAGESVVWRSEPDRGQAHALNKAFDASTGEIVGWLNSDDAYFDESVVERVVEYFERHPDIDVVYGHAAYVNAEGLVLHAFHMPRFSDRMLHAYDYLIQPSVFFRRSAVGETLLDESFHFAMDYELWLRMCAAGKRFARLDKILSIDRAQPGRKSLNLLEVLESDMGRLAQMYGVRRSKGWRALAAAHAVAQRFAGVRLLGALRGPYAYTGHVDSGWSLFVRQCFTRRGNMPVGGE